MAYKVQDLKIYPGGLNLLAPGDQVQDGANIDLTNWWPTSAGRLEQTLGIATISPDMDATDSLVQASNRIYGGGGGYLSQIGRGVIAGGFDGYPLGMISFEGLCWVMNRATQVRDDGTNCVPWWIGGADQGLTLFDLPGLGAGSPNTTIQEYEYYMTWVIQGLGETNPGPVAPITINQNDAVVCQRPALSDAPAGCTGWNIYRQNYVDTDGMPGVLGAVYLLNPVPIPIAQLQYLDSFEPAAQQDDTSLLLLGVIMEDDHDPPPDCSIMANQTFNGRIVVASTLEHPNRMYWTDAYAPAYFPGAQNPNEGNWVDVGTDAGDAILAISVKPKMLVIYRQKSMWRQIGDFDDPNARIECCVPEMGIVGPRAMVGTSQTDYFVASGNRGVYLFNSDQISKLSDPVEPIFLGQVTENFPPLGSAFQSQICLGWRDGRLWLSYPDSTGAMVQCLVYHIESARWFAASFSGEPDADTGIWTGEGFGCFLDIGDQFIAAQRGYILQLETGYSPVFVELAFQSQYYDCGLPDHEKTWADLVIQHNTQASALTVTIRMNKNANPTTDSFTLATISSTTMGKQIIPMVYPAAYAVTALQGQPIVAHNLAVRITGPGATDAPVQIDGPIILHYYLEARRAKTFDTAPGDLGTALYKLIDQVEWSIDASDGPGSMQIYSDTPGNILLPRLAPATPIKQTTGRQNQRIVLKKPIAGKLMRCTATTPSDFRIYGLRARVLPIGVYLDGTIGDFWKPQPTSVGV